MQEIKRYRRQNFGRALPISALFLVGIGILLSALIFMETGWSWLVPMSPAGFGFAAAMVYSFYRKGNEIIEIAPDRISVIAGSHITKTISYSEIAVLKYTYFPNYKPPTIELKGLNCRIDFNAQMEDYLSAIKILFSYLKQKGRDDLIKSYNQQFIIEHDVAT